MSMHRFVWYELVTTDPAAALAFYGRVLGWTAREFAEGAGYWIVRAGDTGVGGVMALPEAGQPPFWLGYVAVADRDEAVAKFTAAGGKAVRVFEVPGVGRMAAMADPQGAMIALFEGGDGGPSQAFEPSRSGHGGWNELQAPDADAAFAFFAGQFGWREDAALEMGPPVGTYRIYAADGQRLGGMMRTMCDAASGWLYYFSVPSVDAAAGAIAEAGGEVTHGPSEVPGGSWIAHGRDPQGARFAVVGPK